MPFERVAKPDIEGVAIADLLLDKGQRQSEHVAEQNELLEFPHQVWALILVPLRPACRPVFRLSCRGAWRSSAGPHDQGPCDFIQKFNHPISRLRKGLSSRALEIGT